MQLWRQPLLNQVDFRGRSQGLGWTSVSWKASSMVPTSETGRPRPPAWLPPRRLADPISFRCVSQEVHLSKTVLLVPISSMLYTDTLAWCMQIVPGKKNIKAAMRAALAEAQGYDDPNDPPVAPLEDLRLDEDEAGYNLTSPNTPKRRSEELKHDLLVRHPTEPLEGAGAAPRSYTESSAPPEGAGGYQTGEFVPPVVRTSSDVSFRSLCEN